MSLAPLDPPDLKCIQVPRLTQAEEGYLYARIHLGLQKTVAVGKFCHKEHSNYLYRFATCELFLSLQSDVSADVLTNKDPVVSRPPDLLSLADFHVVTTGMYVLRNILALTGGEIADNHNLLS